MAKPQRLQRKVVLRRPMRSSGRTAAPQAVGRIEKRRLASVTAALGAEGAVMSLGQRSRAEAGG